MGAAAGRGSNGTDGLSEANRGGLIEKNLPEKNLVSTAAVAAFDAVQLKSWWSEFQQKYTGAAWQAQWRLVECRYHQAIEQRRSLAEREGGRDGETKFFREVCQRDSYFLGKEVLGYKDMNFRLHFPLCVLVSEQRVLKKLLLLPRKHLKTTLATITGSIQDMLRDPDCALLMGTGTAKLVREVTHEIKQHFLHNALLRSYFPEYVPTAREWGTLDAFTLPCRKKIRKEPTWQAASTGTSLTGGSYDKFVPDDLIDLDDVNTKDLLEQTEMWVSMVRFLLKFQDSSPQTWSGTRYHAADIYSKKMNESVEKGGEFIVWLRRWIEDGKAIWEERKSVQLADYQKVMTTGTAMQKATVMAQMMQDPTPLENTVAREKIQYHDDREAEIVAGHVYLNLDTAASAKEQADYHGFVVHLCCWAAGKDGKPRKEIHALEAFQKRVNQFEFWDIVFALAAKYRDLGSPVMGVTLQKEVIENVYLSSYALAMEKHGFPLPLMEARIHKSDKPKRMSQLYPWINDGTYRLRRDQTEFENQLVFGRKSEFDDIADPASDIIAAATWPESPATVAAPVSKPKWTGVSSAKEAWRMQHKQMDEQEEAAERERAQAEAEEREFADVY